MLSPLVIGRATALHPGVVLVSVTAGAVLFGVIGAALAAPVAAAVRAAATALAPREDDEASQQPA